jgi:ADP-ribosyl-[dinitrogen reductase] hydrolase
MKQKHQESTLAAKKDRYLGCLAGLAVGDAVRTILEFKSPGTFPPLMT